MTGKEAKFKTNFKKLKIGDIYTRKNGKMYFVKQSCGGHCFSKGSNAYCAFIAKNHCQKMTCGGQVFIRIEGGQK